MRRAFGVAIDVDGVLLRGKSLLPGAVEAVSYLKENEIPFGVLTNGGGVKEAEFAARLRTLGLPLLGENQICLAHTPLQSLVPQLADELVVCFGRKNPCAVAQR